MSPLLAERHKVRLAYWGSFQKYLEEHDASFRIRTPGKDHWREFPIGRSGFAISTTITMSKRRVGVELYLHKNPGKTAFNQLMADKSAIEREFGEALDWQELPDRRASRIAIFLDGVDASDESAYPRLHAWMLDRMTRFRRVFAGRVRNLDLDEGEGEQHV